MAVRPPSTATAPAPAPSRPAAHDPPVTFLYAPRTQFENLGDALINRAWLDCLRGFGAVVALGGPIPADYAAFVEIAPIGRLGQLRATAAALRTARRDGGRVVRALRPGHFDPTGLGPLAATALGARARAQSLAFRLAGVRTVWAGTSIRLDDLRPAQRYAAIGVIGAADVVIVRDQRSAEALTGLPHRGDAVTVAPDLAFTLPWFGGGRTWAGGPAHLAVSIRRSAVDPDLADQVQAAVAELRATGAAAEVSVVSQVGRDDALATDLSGALGAALVVTGPTSTTFGAACSAYDRADVVISNRLHVLLLAASRGCLPIALADPARDHKLVGIFEDAGLAELVLAPADLSTLPRRLAALGPRASELRAAIAATFERAEAEIDAALAVGLAAVRR